MARLDPNIVVITTSSLFAALVSHVICRRKANAAPMTPCHTYRLRNVPLALQWHARRELAARQNHTRSRFAALARVRSTHMGVNAALAERGTSARPTLIWVMRITRLCISAAGRAAVFMRSPADSQKSVHPTMRNASKVVANRRAVTSKSLGKGKPLGTRSA